jgi:phage gp37-like protein
VADFEKVEYADPLLAALKQRLIEARGRIGEAVQYVKTKPASYLDLSGRRLVDAAIAVIVGHLFLGQGAVDERKRRVARRFIESQMPVLRMGLEQVLAGDMSPLEEYELLAGPVPREA